MQPSRDAYITRHLFALSLFVVVKALSNKRPSHLSATASSTSIQDASFTRKTELRKVKGAQNGPAPTLSPLANGGAKPQ